MLRQWREYRRLSQLALACDAEISTRHLSFLETGRANPSREMILRLAEVLQIPLRERNALLTAGGFAEMYPEKDLDDPELRVIGDIVQTVLSGHEPNPALAIDHRWNLVARNRAVDVLVEGADPSLLQPPVNVMRLGLHPSGVASRILNFLEWRTHAITRLKQRVEATAEPALIDLLKEVQSYPIPDTQNRRTTRQPHELVIPLELSTREGVVNLITTTMVFGTPLDVTVSEIAVECFFPRDPESAAILKRLFVGVPVGQTRHSNELAPV